MRDLLQQLPLLTDLPQWAQDAISGLILLLLAFIAIIILRRVLTWVVLKPLRRYAARTDNKLDDQIIDALMLPLRYLLYGVAIGLVLNAIDFGVEIRAVGDILTRSLIIVGLMLILYRLVDIIALNSASLMEYTGIEIEDRLLPFLRTVAKVLIIVLAILIVIQEWGYDVSALIASLGVVGLAFSLAAKDTAENLFGFSAIVADNPFEVGDYVVLPEAEGTVEHVGVRSTRIRTLDQALIAVPNSKMAQAAVVNWSRLQRRRYNHVIGLSYDTNSAQMRQFLGRVREMLKARELVDEKSVFVRFAEFGDSALNVIIRCYLHVADYNAYMEETEAIHLAIMDIVAEMGLSIAFPSTSVYIERMPTSTTE